MKTHSKWPDRMPKILEEFSQLTVVKLRSPRQVYRGLAGPASRLA
ncbi:hypothetical protein [Nesterenkonia muleiensis]|nr:hypothetical protein [Nesterenkonia muleiensis]